MNIDLATLQALEKMRFSVPMWYPDYDGLYWSEGRTLSVEGGDFQAIENLRIVDKVARRVRLQAIAKIGDRSLNSTPNSIESHKSYFSRTMREMARSTEINGVTFPGECQPPQEGDVAIVWKTKTRWTFISPYAPMRARKALRSVFYWMPSWRLTNESTFIRSKF